MHANDTDRATPRPWRYNDEAPDGDIFLLPESRVDGNSICTMDGAETDEQRLANAALREACNSYEALVAACRAVRQELVDLHAAIADMGLKDRFKDDSIDMLSEGLTAIERADAALALAGEVTK